MIIYLIETDCDFCYDNINGDLNMDSKTTSFLLSKVQTYLHTETSTISNKTYTVALSAYEIYIPNLRWCEIKYLPRKWYCSIAIFYKSGGPVLECQQQRIPSKQHQKQIAVKIIVTKTATETEIGKNFYGRKKRITFYNTSDNVKNKQNSYNNGEKNRRKCKKWSINADCNTKTRNKSNMTLNMAKKSIFGNKDKKVNVNKSEENTMKVQIQQVEQDSEYVKPECNLKLRILIVFCFSHFWYYHIENEFIFMYFLIYCVEFFIEMKNTLNSVFKNGFFLFFVLLVCLNMFKIKSWSFNIIQACPVANSSCIGHAVSLAPFACGVFTGESIETIAFAPASIKLVRQHFSTLNLRYTIVSQSVSYHL